MLKSTEMNKFIKIRVALFVSSKYTDDENAKIKEESILKVNINDKVSKIITMVS